MKKHFLLLSICFLSISVFGQIKEKDAIDSIFSEWNKPDVPGGALGIIKDGKLIYSRGYGSADLEHDIAVTSSSVFYIGSVSKQFVTFSILLLEEQEKLDLDDRVQKYLPDFPEYGDPLTIRHFIHHTSGVRDNLTLMALKGRNYLDEIRNEEVYELIKNQKELNFKPGEKYLYSNSCYFMLAMIIEKASGESLKQFAQKNIFNPLNMKSTIFYDDNTELIKNRVFSYEKSNEEDRFKNLINRFQLVGSGGVYSSVEDLLLWDQNFYDNKLGKGGQAIIEKMHVEGLLNNGESSGYAFALNNGTYKGLKTVSHGGSLAGYRAQLMRFPDQNFSVIILANRSDAGPTSKSFKIADIFLKEEFIVEEEGKKKKKKKNMTSSVSSDFSLKQITGNYELQPGAYIDVSLKNDTLRALQSWNESEYNLVNTTGNTFEIPGDASIQFVFSDLNEDQTQVMTVFQNGRETVCKRKKEVNLEKVVLSSYEGNYYCSELDVTYRFFLEDETLKVSIPSSEPFDLEIIDIDQFSYSEEGALFNFFKTNEKIGGFNLDAGRVTNLKFERQ